MQTATAPGLPDASHTLDVRAFINQRALSRNQWILV